MSGMSRRDLLRASAGAAAVAVPMSVLSSRGVAGASVAAGHAAATTSAVDAASADAAAAPDLSAVNGPVMFCVRDAHAGEVSILHGEAEVIVRDRQLVERILHAAQRVMV
jgi:hypothetical protein